MNSATMSGVSSNRCSRTSHAAFPMWTIACSQWLFLGLTIRYAMARFAGQLRTPYDLLQSLRSLAAGWHLGPDHGSTGRRSRCRSADDRHICHARAPARSLHRGQYRATYGPVARGLTSKIHAVVDANGLPVQLGLTPGEAHDNRLCSVLLAGCIHDRCCWQIEDMTLTGLPYGLAPKRVTILNRWGHRRRKSWPFC